MAILSNVDTVRLLTSLSLVVSTSCTITTDLDDFVGNGGVEAGVDGAAPPITVTSPVTGTGPTSVPPDPAESATTDLTSSPEPTDDDSTLRLLDGGGGETTGSTNSQNDASLTPEGSSDQDVDASAAATTNTEDRTPTDESAPTQAGTESGGDDTSSADDTSDDTAGENTSAQTTDEDTEQTSETPPPDAGSQCPSTLLFEDGFEDVGLEAWTSATIGTDECQQTNVTTMRAHSGNSALHSQISCALEGDAGAVGHQHFGALQFSGDTVAETLSIEGEGIDAPDGVVVSFYVWIDAVEALGDGRWLSLLLLSGACDWSDEVFSLAIEDSSHRLTIGHADDESRTYAEGAPAVASETWTRVTAYINYYDQVFHVWQDGQHVGSATFDRPVETLCHVRVGTFASEDNDDLVVFHDQVRVWRVEKPLADTSMEPCSPSP